MLVIARELMQRTIITTPGGERIVVQVVDIRGREVRLGFEAHASVIIKREELLARPANYGRRLAGPLPIPTKGRDE